jgi:hypothetical protein
VQRVRRGGHGDERRLVEPVAEEPRRHARGDHEVRGAPRAAVEGRFLGAGQRRFREIDARVRTRFAQLLQRGEQPLARERDVHDQPQRGLVAALEAAREGLQRTPLVEQPARASHCSGEVCAGRSRAGTRTDVATWSS